MRCIIVISVVCLQLAWSNGEPRGVGAFAYQDTSGKRYGGTYDLDDAQVYEQAGEFVPPFVDNFHNVNDFFPEYFNNFENLLRETFQTNLDNQMLAITAAKKAYDITSNQAGFIPNFDNRYNAFGEFGGFPGFGFRQDMNGAFASGVAGPGHTHQIAAISPMNPHKPNVNVMRFTDTAPKPDGRYYSSVSTSSFSSDTNVNGQQNSHKEAETIVNNNGVITQYKVES